ncbi:complement component C6 [Protopterus annectens]|uniref:complement component C6 n=1 Tax=Protopterus annectens TaxID=7888 RepID=UPI001CFBAF97|nr:complement component C6 [Protopterus annectens]XP_043925739.1 complement component C6 [Protopterus annectens]
MGCINSLLIIFLSTVIGQSFACYCEHYPWGQWSGCSRSCNYGTQTRSRQIVFDEHYKKNFCDRLCTLHEQRACNQQACPINCQLGDFGTWTDCDPCVQKQFRTRSLIRASQFGGQACSSPLVDWRKCYPSKLCKIEELDCKNKFQCDNGRCIPKSLKCNNENDCGDNSDENDCIRKSQVCTRKFESIPSAQLMGAGYNLMAGKMLGEVLDTTFNGGKCNRVKSNDTLKTYRIPDILESFSFEVPRLAEDENNDDDIKSDVYSSLIDLADGKSGSDTSSSSGHSKFWFPIFFSSKTSSRRTGESQFKTAVKASQKKDSKFIRIHKIITVSKFKMKSTDLHLSEPFLKAIDNLPLEYNYALYSRIFDDFGTHYLTSGSMGGTYDLLYQYSSEELKNSGLTNWEASECVRTETVRRILFWKKRTVRTRCETNKLSEKYDGSFLQSSERSISLVKGGKAEQAAALAWEKQGAFPSNKIFTEWVESAKDNPVVVDFELAPIVNLVKNVHCAVTKRRNLEKAIIEYMEKFDPCRCSPCANNGRAVLSGTECLCVCQAGTYGDNCERRAPDYNSVAVDGYWSCWGPWSSCDSSYTRKRRRECNNPSPLNGGKPCQGLQEEVMDCYFSLFKDEGAICINDDEARKEVDPKGQPDEESGLSGCPKPDPPENGVLRNERARYSVGDQVEILCLSEYERVGYPFYRCLPDGTWKQETLQCKKKTCQRPALSADVSVTPYKIEYGIGETMRLSCPGGMAVTGSTSYTCGSDLSWTPPVMREISCARALPSPEESGCKLGEKRVGAECICMSPEEDCRTYYSEDLCVLDEVAEKSIIVSACQYFAEKCLGQKKLHFLSVGTCSNIDLEWAIQRAKLSKTSTMSNVCGYDHCYDWEKCSGVFKTNQ